MLFDAPITPPPVATTKTISNWGFQNDGGALVLIRPQSATVFLSTGVAKQNPLLSRGFTSVRPEGFEPPTF